MAYYRYAFHTLHGPDVHCADPWCFARCSALSSGRTATVKQVANTLLAEVRAGTLPPFKFFEVNGMKLPVPFAAYTILYKALTGRHEGNHVRACQKLDAYFTKGPPKALQRRHSGGGGGGGRRSSSSSGGGGGGAGAGGKPPVCVLLVDELDYMVTKKQTVLYNLFDWPHRPNARLVVIGISNTMDLPERLMPRIHSRMGKQKVQFRPYDRVQIQKIVTARLLDLEAFEKDAIEMCARKVAAVSGDVRRALQMCRRAAQKCMQDGRARLVTIEHINRAAKELSSSLVLQAIATAAEFEKLFLVTLYKHSQATGAEGGDLTVLHAKFVHTCTAAGHATGAIPPLRRVREMCRRLGVMRLLEVHDPLDGSLEGLLGARRVGRAGMAAPRARKHADDEDEDAVSGLVDAPGVLARNPIVRLNCDPDDVRFALRDDESLQQKFF